MSMRRLVVTVVVALSAVTLAVPLAAVGGGPKEIVHERVFDDAGTDPDFCGTGETVEFEGRSVATLRLGETGGDPEQPLLVTFAYRYTITNPANGNAIVDSAAGSTKNVIVVGQESEAHVHEFTENGLRAKLQLANGRVLTRDAGSLTYRVSFDENGDFLDLEVVSDRGTHAAFDSDLWCDVATDALGL